MCRRGGILTAGNYLEAKSGKYRLEFRNSGLHLSCGFTSIWRYGYSNNEALYLDSEGLSLVLLNKPWYLDNWQHYKSVTIWNASTEGHAKVFFLQDDGNLGLINNKNKIMWQTKTSGACPKGLEQFVLFQLFYELSKIICHFASKDNRRVITLKSSNYLFLWLAAI